MHELFQQVHKHDTVLLRSALEEGHHRCSWVVTCSRPAAGSRARCQKPSVSWSRPPHSDRDRRVRAATLTRSSGAGSIACDKV